MLSSLIIRFRSETDERRSFAKIYSKNGFWSEREKKTHWRTSIGFQYFGKALRKENFWFCRVVVSQNCNLEKFLVSSSHFTIERKKKPNFSCYAIIKMRRKKAKHTQNEKLKWRDPPNKQHKFQEWFSFYRLVVDEEERFQKPKNAS